MGSREGALRRWARWRGEHPDHKEVSQQSRRLANARWYADRCDKQRRKEYQKQHTLGLKAQVYAAYGNKCACCREAESLFLSLDHVNNDGAGNRKSKAVLYRWLIKNEFPSSFQILCFNCNLGKHLNGGVCPHQSNPTA